jgi:hypothetical protein
VLDVAVETPQGDVIDEANATGFPTVTRVVRPNMTYYRMTLPVDDGGTVHAHAGTWKLVLTVDPKMFKRYSGANPTQEAFCHLLGCLARSLSPELKGRLAKDGWSIDELLKCTCS